MSIIWRIIWLVIYFGTTSSSEETEDPKCGTTEVMPSEATNGGLFIIGGKKAHPRMFPWVGYLAYDNPDHPLCTISLISRKWAVTASHCIRQGRCPHKSYAVFGVVSLSDAEKKHIYKAVRFLHPKKQHVKLERTTMYVNDIALVELEKEVDIDGSNGAINTICLPSRKMELSGKLFLVGWGATSYDTLDPSEALKYMVSKLLNRTSCPPLESKFCTMGVKAKETPYRGDSGGPALKLVDGRYYLYGVLHGKDKKRAKYRSFYTNVFEFIDWIQNYPESETKEIICKR